MKGHGGTLCRGVDGGKSGGQESRCNFITDSMVTVTGSFHAVVVTGWLPNLSRAVQGSVSMKRGSASVGAAPLSMSVRHYVVLVVPVFSLLQRDFHAPGFGIAATTGQ